MSQKHAAAKARSNLMSQSRENDVARHYRDELTEFREHAKCEVEEFQSELVELRRQQRNDDDESDVLDQRIAQAQSERDQAILEMKESQEMARSQRDRFEQQIQEMKNEGGDDDLAAKMNEFELREKTMRGEMSALTNKLDRFVSEIEQMQVSEARLQEKNLRLECKIAAATQRKMSGE